MGPAATTLVLFDIDGTLISTAGAGVRGMSDAIERLHGWSRALDGIPVSGRTDRAILTDVFHRRNQSLSDATVEPLRESYVDALKRELGDGERLGVGVLPGVEAALDVLEADDAFVSGLLTGNFARSAEVKLAHFNLWHRFRFGAFGDHHADRRALVGVAIEQARMAGFDATDVVVIGDTPFDVDCALAAGARSVAVATGEFSADALATAGADIVASTLDVLRPLTATLTALCATGRRR